MNTEHTAHNPSRLYRGPIGLLLEPLVRLLRGRGLTERHPALWKLHRRLWFLSGSNRVAINGHDMEVDKGDSLALASGPYEPEEAAWYEQTVRPGDLIVELGANIGYFSLAFARLTGPSGQVIAYEADPELAGILARNATANGYPTIDVRNVAVADHSGTMTFHRSTETTGDNRLFAHGIDRDSFPVTAVALDEDLRDLTRRIDLLKMDIQGAEPLALDGFRHILAERPPRRILMEFWPHGIAGMGRDPAQVVGLLRDAGYRITRLDDGRELDLEQALRELTPENLEFVNLVCVHATADTAC